MAKSNTFGDQITLFAAANLYNINIQVISTLGPGAQHLFEPSPSVPLGTVFLGHFAAGEHYVSLLHGFLIVEVTGLNVIAEVVRSQKELGEVARTPVQLVLIKVVEGTQVVMARVKRKQLLTANVTEIHTEVAGTQVLAEVAGT